MAQTPSAFGYLEINLSALHCLASLPIGSFARFNFHFLATASYIMCGLRPAKSPASRLGRIWRTFAIFSQYPVFAVYLPGAIWLPSNTRDWQVWWGYKSLLLIPISNPTSTNPIVSRHRGADGSRHYRGLTDKFGFVFALPCTQAVGTAELVCAPLHI